MTSQPRPAQAVAPLEVADAALGAGAAEERLTKAREAADVRRIVAHTPLERPQSGRLLGLPAAKSARGTADHARCQASRDSSVKHLPRPGQPAQPPRSLVSQITCLVPPDA